MKFFIIIGCLFLGAPEILFAMKEPNIPYTPQDLEKYEHLLSIPFKKSTPILFTQEFSIYTESCSYYAISSTSGRRQYMEDTNSVEYFGYNNKFYGIFFGLFDGHGGDAVSLSLSQCLFNQYIQANIQENQPIELAIKNGYSSANANILNDPWFSENQGSLALCAFILNNNQLIIANVGDSRAIVGTTEKKVDGAIAYSYTRLTNDHQLDTNEDERTRIKTIGGKIFQDHQGTYRIAGLAVSRAFGHASIAQYITPDPDIFTYEITTQDQFLILASDGLWDVLENQDVVNIALPLAETPKDASQALVEAALREGSYDNITVIVINLAQYMEA
jgi:protein phosphatase 1L